MKNLFKGARVTITNEIINNEHHNKLFAVAAKSKSAMGTYNGRSLELPATETSKARFLREMDSTFEYQEHKLEREFTDYQNNNTDITVYYISFNGSSVWIKEKLAKMLKSGKILSVEYGTVKVDASFQPSK